MPEERFFQSKTFRRVLYGLGIVAAALVIFQAGFFVGTRRAFFNCKWGENYYRNFEGEGRGGEFGRRDIGGHGVSGAVISVKDSTIAIMGRDNVERLVVTATGTSIMRQRDVIGVSDLKSGENVMVLGSPNDAGQIEASLIRVMPALPPPPMPAMPVPPPFGGPGVRR